MSFTAVSLCKLEIDCSQGNFQIEAVSDYDVSDDSKVNALNAVGYRTPQGKTRSPGAITIGVTIYRVQGKQKLDLAKLQDTEENFLMTKRDVGGRSVQYQNVSISSLSTSGDSDGKNEDKVEFLALEAKRL